ncbi:MAG: glycoside hydrolase family 43 protein [Bacteroidales bacterium]
MKITVILILSSILLAACGNEKQYSGNPLFKGWYADPEAITDSSSYWIFPTYSAPYDEQVFLDAFSSKDMLVWEKHDRVIDTSSVKWLKRAMWAPSVIKQNGRWFLFFGGNDIQNDNETGGIGVAVSDSPGGPYKDYLGKPLIGKFYNGAQPIDQFAFRDKDGTVYLIYGGWRHCNIVKLKPDFTGIDTLDDGTVYKEITPDGYVEGPFMFTRGGKYYFMWSEGGWTGPDYSVAYAIADSPFGPFVRQDKILRQDSTIATGAGHHSVLKARDEDNYFIVYHRRPLGETDRNARVVCIDKLLFDENGFIKPVVMTNTGIGSK